MIHNALKYLTYKAYIDLQKVLSKLLLMLYYDRCYKSKTFDFYLPVNESGPSKAAQDTVGIRHVTVNNSFLCFDTISYCFGIRSLKSNVWKLKT